MKMKHYLLIAFTIIAIAFFQPLIMLLGGLTLIGAVTAFIYADLRPAAQDAFEQKATQVFGQLRSSLRRPAAAGNNMPVATDVRPAQRLTNAPVTEVADNADNKQRAPRRKTAKASDSALYNAATPDL